MCPQAPMGYETTFILRTWAQWLVSELCLNLAAPEKCPSSGAGLPTDDLSSDPVFWLVLRPVWSWVVRSWTSLASLASSRKSWFLFVLGKFADKHIHGSFSTGAREIPHKCCCFCPYVSTSLPWLRMALAKPWQLFFIIVTILNAYLIMGNDLFYPNFKPP